MTSDLSLQRLTSISVGLLPSSPSAVWSPVVFGLRCKATIRYALFFLLFQLVFILFVGDFAWRSSRLYHTESPLFFCLLFWSPAPFIYFSEPSQASSFLEEETAPRQLSLGFGYVVTSCLRSQSTRLQPERPPLSGEVAVAACTQLPVSSLLPQPPSTHAGLHCREAGGEATCAVLASATEDRIAFLAFLPRQPFHSSSSCP